MRKVGDGPPRGMLRLIVSGMPQAGAALSTGRDTTTRIDGRLHGELRLTIANSDFPGVRPFTSARRWSVAGAAPLIGVIVNQDGRPLAETVNGTEAGNDWTV